MDIELLKWAAVPVILLVALGGGLLPHRFGTSRNGLRLLALGSCFAAGVFLAAGLIHLLNDGQEKFAAFTTGTEYPLALSLAGAGMLFILLIEKVAIGRDESAAASARQPYLLLTVLSVHSLIAGASLGLEGTVATFLVILVAILAHKGFAAFALGISFVESGVARSNYLRLLLFFSFTTPLGVILGAIAAGYLHSRAATGFEAVFDSLAAGTFLYVATMDLMSESFAERAARWGKFLSVASGFALMASLALWT